MAGSAPKSSSERTAAYRARKKSAGYRLVQRWVSDVGDPAVRERLRLHCEAINREPGAPEDQAYLDHITDWADD